MFIVTRFIINNDDTEAHSSQKYEEEIPAKKRFYSIVASDIDSANIKYEMAQVVREDGITIMSQVFDNRPAPEPEVAAE